MYSSLKEAFQFSLSLFADEHNTKIDQEKCEIEQICIWNPMIACVQPPLLSKKSENPIFLRGGAAVHGLPHDYRIYFVNIDLCN